MYCTGRPLRLFPRCRWHRNISCILVKGAYTETKPLFWCQPNLGNNLIVHPVQCSDINVQILRQIANPQYCHNIQSSLYFACRTTSTSRPRGRPPPPRRRRGRALTRWSRRCASTATRASTKSPGSSSSADTTPCKMSIRWVQLLHIPGESSGCFIGFVEIKTKIYLKLKVRTLNATFVLM